MKVQSCATLHATTSSSPGHLQCQLGTGLVLPHSLCSAICSLSPAGLAVYTAPAGLAVYTCAWCRSSLGSA